LFDFLTKGWASEGPEKLTVTKSPIHQEAIVFIVAQENQRFHQLNE
jgi:hypothetical protein